MTPLEVSRTSSRGVRWSVYVLIAILFAIACGFLSQWQFDRNSARAAQLALVEQNHDAVAVPFAEIVPPGTVFSPADEWRPVELAGRYLVDEQLLVRNRPHGGTSAFEVLVPFELADGRVLVVDRGWVAPGAQDLPDEIPAPPGGEATVVVRLRVGEPLPASGRSAPDGQVPTINLDAVADRLSGPVAARLERSAYGTLVNEDPAPATRPVALAPPSEDPGPHLSYAIQWILFAIMGFVFIGYVIRTEVRHRREDRDDDDAATTDRRRDRDAEDEDALVSASGR